MHATKAFKFNLNPAAEAAAIAGQFAGRASVYGVVDGYNDVVMPGAFTKTLAEKGNRILVLNQHNPSDPIGAADLTDSDTALFATGQLVLDLPSAKDMYTRLQNSLINGISIGYEVTKESYVGGIRQLQEINLWEISLCTFPANQFARVTDVKHAGQLASFEDIVLHMTAEVAAIKAGRVLNSTNLSRLQQIMSLAQAILDSAQTADPSSTGGGDTTVEASTSPQERAALEQLSINLRSLIAAAKE